MRRKNYIPSIKKQTHFSIILFFELAVITTRIDIVCVQFLIAQSDKDV